MLKRECFVIFSVCIESTPVFSCFVYHRHKCTFVHCLPFIHLFIYFLARAMTDQILKTASNDFAKSPKSAHFYLKHIKKCFIWISSFDLSFSEHDYYMKIHRTNSILNPPKLYYAHCSDFVVFCQGTASLSNITHDVWSLDLVKSTTRGIGG